MSVKFRFDHHLAGTGRWMFSKWELVARPMLRPKHNLVLSWCCRTIFQNTFGWGPLTPKRASILQESSTVFSQVNFCTCHRAIWWLSDPDSDWLNTIFSANRLGLPGNSSLWQWHRICQPTCWKPWGGMMRWFLWLDPLDIVCWSSGLYKLCTESLFPNSSSGRTCSLCMVVLAVLGCRDLLNE